MTRPQVAVLTRVELALPLCARQSPSPSLSAIRLSAVSGSGTRRNASARLEQRDALLRVQPIFLEELVDPALALRGAQLGEHGRAPASRPRPRESAIERGVAQQRRQHLGFGRAEQAAGFRARADAVASAMSIFSRGACLSPPCGPMPRRDIRRTIGGGSMPVASIDEIKGQIGSEVGVSDWILVDQARIDAFADVTEDHQFIHVDPDGRGRRRSAARSRTASSPCRCSAGWRRTAMLRAGRHARWASITASTRSASSRRSARASACAAASSCSRFEEKRARPVAIHVHEVTVEIEGEDKPALIADWIGLIFV